MEVHFQGEIFLLLASLGKKALSCSVRLTMGTDYCWEPATQGKKRKGENALLVSWLDRSHCTWGMKMRVRVSNHL